MIRSAIFVATVVCCSGRVGAQASPLVPPGERVYRDLDRLAAAGLIKTLVVGARPFSEREIVRLLNEARQNLGSLAGRNAWATETIDADLARYTRTGNRIYDEVRAEVVALDSPYRGVAPDANGQLNAVINPLAANRSGRPVTDGLTGSLESIHSAALGPHVVAVLNPRATAWSRRSDGSDGNVQVQSAALDLQFGNFRLEAGRDYTIFGQAPLGSMLLSANAPTMNLVRISNDHPAKLPWIFGVFGPIRASGVVGDLGEDAQIHPHAKVAAYHIAALPNPHFEIGVEVLDAMGGSGGQKASFGDRLVDAIPLIDALFRSGTDFQFSNKMAGLDFHWRMPEWRGFELYAEGDVDDFDIRRWQSSLLEDGGIVAGLAISCLTECGRLGIRGEYRQTGIRYYTHSDYPLERRQLLLGDPLGPRGLSANVTVDGESSAGYFALNGAFEVRSGNQYGSSVNGPDTEGFHFVLIAQRPAEKRLRAVATWNSDRGNQRVALSAALGVERMTNFAFVAGANRVNWLARTAITLRP